MSKTDPSRAMPAPDVTAERETAELERGLASELLARLRDPSGFYAPDFDDVERVTLLTALERMAAPTGPTAGGVAGVPTVECLDNYEALATWLFEWRHRSKPYKEMMRVSSPDVRENWLRVAKNTAPTLAAILARLAEPRAGAGGPSRDSDAPTFSPRLETAIQQHADCHFAAGEPDSDDEPTGVSDYRAAEASESTLRRAIRAEIDAAPGRIERRDEDGFGCDWDGDGSSDSDTFTVWWEKGARWVVISRSGNITAGESKQPLTPATRTTWDDLRHAGRDDAAVLREAAQAVVDDWFTANRFGGPTFTSLVEKLRATLATAGGDGSAGETFASIAQWCEETFGPIAPERIVSRAAEEMDELRAEPTKVEEAADVVIVLSRYPGLWDAVQRKMAVNRARKWRLMGDGTGYHVKEAPPTAQPETAS